MNNFFVRSSFRTIILILLTICFSSAIEAQSVIRTGITISFDGRKMIYAAVENDTVYHFYQTQKIGAEQWSNGSLIKEFDNYFAGATSVSDPFLSYDGLVLYFSAAMKGSKGKDIYYSLKTPDGWSTPTRMDEAINSDGNEENPSLSADNMSLFFSRYSIPAKPEAESEICRTIYKAVRNEQGIWQKAEVVKLSPQGCEAFPLVTPDGKTLVFASNKISQKRKQKYDVYYSREITPGVWTFPETTDSLNIGADDLSIAIDHSPQQLCVLKTEIIKKDTKIDFACYKLPPDFKLKTFTTVDATLSTPDKKVVNATIQITDALTRKPLAATSTNDGKYRIMLANGANYYVDITAADYAKQSRLYQLIRQKESQSINSDTVLFANVQLLLNVYDKGFFSPLNANITIHRASDNKAVANADIKKDIAGQIKVQLPIGENYKITLQAANYNDYTFAFNLAEAVTFNSFEEDIALNPIKKAYTLNISSSREHAPTDALVEIRNMDVDEIINIKQLKTGEYSTDLRKGARYALNVTKQAYSFYNSTIDANTDKPLPKTAIQLVPLIKNTQIPLKSVAFVANSAEPVALSYNELNCVAQLLLDNPELTIEIETYVDDKLDATYQEKTINKQTQNLVNYLLSKGITKDRVTGKSYAKNNDLAAGTSKTRNYHAAFTITTPAKEWAGIEETLPESNTATKTTTTPKPRK